MNDGTVGGIIGGLVFEDGEGGAKQLVDEGADHGHFAQAALRV